MISIDILVNKEVKDALALDGVYYTDNATFKSIKNKELISELMFESKFKSDHLALPIAFAEYRGELVGYMMEPLKNLPSINYLNLTNKEYDKNKVLTQLINTLNELESNGYIYDGINSSNILVDEESNIKIIDLEKLNKNINIESLIKYRNSILDIVTNMYYGISLNEMIRSKKYLELDTDLLSYIDQLNNEDEYTSITNNDEILNLIKKNTSV